MYFFIGMVVFFMVTLTIIHRVEKRMVWPYSEPQPQPLYDDPSGYGARWVAQAVQSGFTLLGWSHDLKGETYRVNYAMLISPDRSTIATIGAGAILKLPLQATWLHTPAADGRCFYSTNQQSGVQLDVSRHWTNQLVPAPNFAKLWQRHQAWTRDLRVLPRTLRSGHELEEYRAVREAHFRSMASAGLINFIDPGATRFQFTLYGAFATATKGYFLGLLRAVTQGRFPKSA